jgi:hypothetical protein
MSVPLKAWTIVSAEAGAGPEAGLPHILGEMGFTTQDEERLLMRRAVIGEAGPCRIWMAVVSGEGWHRDIVVSSAPKTADVVFFFKGRAYADQPAWATWFDEKASVLARSFAMPLRPSPVVAAYLGKGCALDRGALAARLGTL